MPDGSGVGIGGIEAASGAADIVVPILPNDLPPASRNWLHSFAISVQKKLKYLEAGIYTPEVPIAGTQLDPYPQPSQATSSEVGQLLIDTADFQIIYQRATISDNGRMSLIGTARLVLTDLHGQDSVILGTPRTPPLSFTVPTEYVLDQMTRLTLTGGMRATLQGTADLIITDDFKTRQRLVLTGGPQ